jgi:hypothetical protein
MTPGLVVGTGKNDISPGRFDARNRAVGAPYRASIQQAAPGILASIGEIAVFGQAKRQAAVPAIVQSGNVAAPEIE